MKRMTLAAAAAMAVLVAVPCAAQSAGTPITTKSGTITTPPAGKAQIVFWRPGTFVGAALGCTVHEGDAEIARLGSGKYWVTTAEPGKHVYFSKGEKTDTLNMELEPDETYFVKCSIGMGIVSGRAQLSPSDRATFEGKAAKMTLWNKKDKDEKADTPKTDKPAAAN